MMNIPFQKKPTASTADLETQLGAAEAECDAAGQALESALAGFDAAGDESAATALKEARERINLANEYRARAERLLSAARAKAEADNRRALVIERDRLAAELSEEGISRVRNPLVEQEVALLLQLVDLLLEKIRRGEELDRTKSQLASIRRQLGEPSGALPTPGGVTMVDRVASTLPIEEHFQALICAEPEKVRQRVLNAVLRSVKERR